MDNISTISSTVSYEQFLPRSSTQREAISRVEKLVTAPTLSNHDLIRKYNHVTSLLYCYSYFLRYNDHEENNMIKPEVDLVYSTLEKSKVYSHHLRSLIDLSQSLHSSISTSMSLAHDISHSYDILKQSSSDLSFTAERINTESCVLTEHAAMIETSLRHYDTVDRLGPLLGLFFENKKFKIIRDSSSGITSTRALKTEDINGFRRAIVEIDNAIFFFSKHRSLCTQHPSLSVDDNGFESKLSESTVGIGKKSTRISSLYSGLSEYLSRALTLRNSIFDLIKEAVVDRIENTSKNIVKSLNLVRRRIPGDKLESSLIYTKFYGISHGCQRIIKLLSERMKVNIMMIESEERNDHSELINIESVSCKNRNRDGDISETEKVVVKETLWNVAMYVEKIDTTSISTSKNPYAALWKLCRNTFIRARENLLSHSIREHLEKMCIEYDLVGMTRLASVFLMRLCSVESSLYLQFFSCEINEINTDKLLIENEDVNNVFGNPNNHKPENNNKIRDKSANKIQSNYRTQQSSYLHKVLSPSGKYYDNDFQSYLDRLCMCLHHTVRRGVVNITDLDTLCRIICILREEYTLAGSSAVTLPVAQNIGKLIMDVQERLIFRANLELNEEVVKFRPNEEKDLDYPDRLIHMNGLSMKEFNICTVVNRNICDYDDFCAGSVFIKDNKKLTEEKKIENILIEKDGIDLLKGDKVLRCQIKSYQLWFPPIRSLLRILSKIFGAVESRVFEDIALWSVQACTKSLNDSVTLLRHNSDTFHADLFLVRHLLILREQLSPFDIQLKPVERYLDFSKAGKAVSHFLSNNSRSCFSMSTENALLNLFREGVSIKDSTVDYRRLENILRLACSNFFERATVCILGPIIKFVDKWKEIEDSEISSNLLLSKSTTFCSQTFLEAKTISFNFARALERFNPEFNKIAFYIRIYIDNATTRRIIFKPIFIKVIEALEKTRRFISFVKERKYLIVGCDDDTIKILTKYSDDIETQLRKSLSKLGWC